jgi:hypothetical protein
MQRLRGGWFCLGLIAAGCGDDDGGDLSTTTMEPPPPGTTTGEPGGTTETPDPTTGAPDPTTGAPDPTTGPVSMCGDGVVDGGEQCDDGDEIGDNACAGDCTYYVPPACPGEYVVCDDGLDLADKSDKAHALAAMGVCNDRGDDSVLVTDFTFVVDDSASWQVARGYGSFEDPDAPGQPLFSPREGETLLILSTGRISAPDGDGVVLEGEGSQLSNDENDNPDMPNLLPAPLSPDLGSNQGAGGLPFNACDGVNDCSDTIYEQWWELNNGDPNDMLFFKLDVTVPLGTHGYSFDMVFCSAEWPVYVDTGYNDMFITWQTDPGAYVGNVAYVHDPMVPSAGLPFNATTLDQYFKDSGYTQDAPQLAGTGFETHACTGWLTVKGGVQPGAHVTLGFFLSDQSDQLIASQVILDNFRWDCAGCDPASASDCGVQDP